VNPQPAISFLRIIEWNMGNGQCRYCCGLRPGKFFSKVRPHPSAPTPQHEGHIQPCGLGEALEGLGEKVVWRQVPDLDELRPQRSGDPK
jgi:hypothetical protein